MKYIICNTCMSHGMKPEGDMSANRAPHTAAQSDSLFGVLSPLFGRPRKRCDRGHLRTHGRHSLCMTYVCEALTESHIFRCNFPCPWTSCISARTLLSSCCAEALLLNRIPCCTVRCKVSRGAK